MIRRVPLAAVALLGVATFVGLSVWALRVLKPASIPTVDLDATRSRPQGDVLVGAFPEPKHLNPLTNIDAAVRSWVLRFTHDTLCEIDAQTGAVRPALAESVVTEAGSRLRIRLRRDARFSDGAPVTAEDVAFSHRCACSSGLPMSAMVRAARMALQLEAISPHELVGRVVDNWSARDVFATGLLVLSRAAVLARVSARAQAKGVSVPSPRTPEFTALLAELPDLGPGSGPYALAPPADDGALWSRGQHLDLVQNPHSWHRRAAPESWNLAGLRQVFVQDPAAEMALLRQEQLDWLGGDVRGIAAADASIAERYRVVVYDPPTLGHFMVAWNCREGPLADARVRRALAMLFDRDAIAQRLLHGDAVPAATWFKPGRPEVPGDLAPPAYDPASARAALRAAGYGADHPLRIDIVGAAQEPLHRRILELAQASFAAAGVELVPQLVEAGVLLDRLQRRDFMGLLALKYHVDPWVDPWLHFHSSQVDGGGLNWMGFVDAETDRLLGEARGEHDDARRAETYRAFCRRIDDLQPVALLVHPRTALLLHRRFRDAEVSATGLSPERWWVPLEEQRHR